MPLDNQISAMTQVSSPPSYNITSTAINKIDDQKKHGDVHSRIIHKEFSMGGRTSGISPDVERFVFEKRAEIVGILVSIDHANTGVVLFEFAARINAMYSGYGQAEPLDVLIHTSFSCNYGQNCHGNTDQNIWFGKNSGIEVGEGEWIAFGAWMGNESLSKVGVHSEFIVWYRWLE